MGQDGLGLVTRVPSVQPVHHLEGALVSREFSYSRSSFAVRSVSSSQNFLNLYLWTGEGDSI